MLQSEVDTSTYMNMRRSWKLNDRELLGTDVLLEVKMVHVLVELPKLKHQQKTEVLVISKIKEPKVEAVVSRVLDDFKILSASTHDFQLDSLFTTQQIWKGFGECPPNYFVRMEACVFWKMIKDLLFSENRAVIVSSPGVDKSCFLMLIAFYLACIEKKKVLVFRRLKRRDSTNVLVFFNGVGSYARLTNLVSHELHAIRQHVNELHTIHQEAHKL
ncbi:Crinkler (CRN) [Phytophthora megakarya]|uniref:Crinkler (CRN) n=1 Tax=Phytophthora megakarya TaxID=4795 RepID=A0A225UQ86_9STRA|nr:Crinkler (CRN) [Phytophthora megakarya]